MSDSSIPNSPMLDTCDNTLCCKVCDPKKKYFNCICGQNWNTFEEHLSELKQDHYGIIKNPLTISTMTICANFNSHVNLDKLADLYVSSIKYTPAAKKTKKVEKKGSFYNSLLMNMSIKYQNLHSKNNKKNKKIVAVKFFPNGKIQIAGCNTIKSASYAIRKSYKRLLSNDCFLEENSKITESKIVMINTDFKLKYNLNQDALTEVLSQQTIDKNYNFLQVVYQSSKYPGINAKFIPDEKLLEFAKFQLEHGFKKKYSDIISILIFRPGSIIITGGNKIVDYISAVKSITGIINTNKELVTVQY